MMSHESTTSFEFPEPSGDVAVPFRAADTEIVSVCITDDDERGYEILGGKPVVCLGEVLAEHDVPGGEEPK